MARLLQWRDADAERDFAQYRALDSAPDPNFDKRISEAKRLRAEMDLPKVKKL
jgi:hypothetical protein